MKQLLLCGPWQGEFGWEICIWQPHLRYLSQTMKADKIVVSIQPTHEVLYQDFANGFIYNKRGRNSDGWRNRDNDVSRFPNSVLDELKRKNKDYYIKIISPNDENMSEESPKTFIRFGKKESEYKYDILMHARWTNKCNSGDRNWSLKRWEEISKHFKRLNLKMASIGLKSSAKHIPYTDYLLNMDLNNMTNIMANSRLIIGPSSGPLHLASFCGCPQLVWTNNKYWKSINGTNRKRWETAWNPFQTKVIVLDDCNWQPRPKDVIRSIENLLSIKY